jgi:hypothetical protein
LESSSPGATRFLKYLLKPSGIWTRSHKVSSAIHHGYHLAKVIEFAW